MRNAVCRVAGTVALLGAVAFARSGAQAVTVAPLASGEVTFLVHAAIVGGISGRAQLAHAEFTGDQLGAVRGQAEVRAADMQTGNGARDRHMRLAMDADSFPTIRFDLVAVQPGPRAADSTSATFEGRLTLHGVTRPVLARGTVVLRPDGADVVATFPLDMRDYGIIPPLRALVLRVAPDVVVTVRLSFRPRPTS
jgi:polyisoprenoid-binding protein YceI